MHERTLYELFNNLFTYKQILRNNINYNMNLLTAFQLYYSQEGLR